MTSSVFTEDAWLSWCERVSGQRAERFQAGTEAAAVRGIWFRGDRGQIRQVPLMPYIPLESSLGLLNSRSQSALVLMTEFAESLAAQRIRGGVVLPPEWTDARPFQWAGLTAELRYTYLISLPHDSSLINRSVTKRIRKAERLGYTFHAERDDNAMIQCLESTERRQSFSHGIPVREVPKLLDTLAPDDYWCHLVRDSGGNTVSAGVRLRSGASAAHDWLQGTERDALKDGAVQLMYRGVLDDLTSSGITSFDFGGANIRAVASAKADWGGRLTPMLLIKDTRATTLLRSWIVSRRRATRARRKR